MVRFSKKVQRLTELEGDLGTLFEGYARALHDAAFLDYIGSKGVSEASNLLDFNKKRREEVIIKGRDLVASFDAVHLEWGGKFVELWARYHDVQEVDRRRLAKEKFDFYKAQIVGALRVYAVRADVLLKEAAGLGDVFEDDLSRKLQALSKLKFPKLQSSWFAFVHPLTGEELPDLPDET